MSKDEIIRMAREAGWSGIYTTYKKPDGIEAMESSLEHLTVPVTKEQIERAFALIREAMIAELVAGSGEPVAWAMKDAAGNVVDTITEDDRQRSMSRWADCYPHPLYTADQMAAAVAIEREWLRKCLLVMEREAKWAFDDLNEEPDVLNADIAALKEHLK